MPQIGLFLLALGCLVTLGAAQTSADVESPVKDVLLLHSPKPQIIEVHEDARQFFTQIEDPLRLVSLVGPVKNTNKIMHSVVDRPYFVEGPLIYGVEFWPKLLNISVPHHARLMSIHYDHETSVFEGDSLTEAKMTAIMTLISSHLVYNFDHIQSRHPLSQFEFLAEKRIPALILRDLVRERQPEQLTNINWPKIKSFLMAYDGSFEEFCKDHEFPEYLWPDLSAMVATGRYGSKTIACGHIIKAMVEDHDSYEVVLDGKFVDLSKEVHQSSTGPNMLKFIEILVEIVNDSAFEDRYYQKMNELKKVKRDTHNYFVNRFGHKQHQLGGKPTPPTPIEPTLPPIVHHEL